MKHFSISDLSGMLDAMRRPYQRNYLAMYSSLYGGIVTDPALMLLPIDDHVVHRGDGVFETIKCVSGAIYNLPAHLTRLEHSASVLNHQLPLSRDQMTEIMIETVRAGGARECAIRLLVSRGPGGFGVNPYECEGSQIYMVVTSPMAPFMDKHPQGATVQTSHIPMKPSFFAGVKNCNYLPNVLMKKESIDAGVDFVVAFDSRGCMGEGATENVGLVTAERELLFPRLDAILCGTTMMRVAELARREVEKGTLTDVRFDDLPRERVLRAAEMLIVGTSPNVTAATRFDGRPVGAGVPGPVYKVLSKLLLDDLYGNPDLRTPVW